MVRLVWLVLLLATAPAWGQLVSVSRLQQRLATAPADTSRVLLLAELCQQESTQNTREALTYGQQGLALARRLHYGYGAVSCLNALARVEMTRQRFVNASRYYQQAVREAERTPRAARLLTFALMGLGQLAAEQNEFAEADAYLRLALRRVQQQPASPLDLMVARQHLATLYLGWLQAAKPAPDSLARLHEYYARLALSALRQIPAAQQSQISSKLGFCFDHAAMAHLRAGRLDSAAYYSTRAIALARQAGNRYGLIHAQQLLAEVRLAQHAPSQAAALVRPTIGWSAQLASLGLEVQGRQLLARALDQAGHSHEAYELTQRGQVLLDSLNSTTQRTALARLRVQFGTERQRDQVRTLLQRSHLQQSVAQKQRQQLLWLGALLLAVAAGLAGSGTLAWRLRRSQRLLAQQNAELTATRAEQDRLYALVAHDLRSPVEAFTGLADLLTRYVERQETARLAGLGGRVRQAAYNLRGLLDNLLSWALTQRGELTPQLEKLAVAPLLAEAAELYQPSAEAAGLTLGVVAGPGGYVLADLNMTRAILRNLISNALRATPAGGTIMLAVAPRPAGVALEVRDTGEGMSADQLRQLLAAAPLPMAGRPAGLGLRLSQAFALAQGGSLALTSQPEHGTIAALTLPGAVVSSLAEEGSSAVADAPIAATARAMYEPSGAANVPAHAIGAGPPRPA